MPEPCLSKTPGKCERAAAFFALQSRSGRVRRPRNGFFENYASLQILRPESAGFQQNLDREAAAGKFASLSTSMSKSLFGHAGALSVENPGKVREGCGLFCAAIAVGACTAATERIFRKKRRLADSAAGIRRVSAKSGRGGRGGKVCFPVHYRSATCRGTL